MLPFLSRESIPNFPRTTTPRGIHSSTILCSLIQSAKLQSLSVYDYFHCILRSSQLESQKDHEGLLPFNLSSATISRTEAITANLFLWIQQLWVWEHSFFSQRPQEDRRVRAPIRSFLPAPTGRRRRIPARTRYSHPRVLQVAR